MDIIVYIIHLKNNFIKKKTTMLHGLEQPTVMSFCGAWISKEHVIYVEVFFFMMNEKYKKNIYLRLIIFYILEILFGNTLKKYM